jgi:peptidoglycan/LPS O-acetylase OafA/YrhL
LDYQLSSTYRPDIDALRAIAVLSVLLFHSFPEWLPGGFVGVDIFFVISGFLITGIIWREFLEGHFSLSNFYARRVRRIFPALIVVLIACLVFGWFVLFETEYKQLGDHSMRASVFLINFQLWKESGYFDVQSELKPLLHLWSLSIEEQYYLVWPVVLWLLFRFCKNPLFWLLILFFASFIWNIYQSLTDSAQDFYSPLTRFWELTAGALLAISLPKYSDRIKEKNIKIIGLVGFFILISGMLVINLATIYPGAWAVWPVLGTVCFIVADGKLGWLKSFVTLPTMLWIGKISFPLYLWHWPVLSFARIIEGQTPAVELRIACIGLSLVLAALTAKYIEPFFRLGPISMPRVWLLVFTMTMVTTIGYEINRRNGVPERELVGDEYISHHGSIGQEADLEILNYSNAQPDIAIFGDSHANHLFLGLTEALPNSRITSYSFSTMSIINNHKARDRLDDLLRESTIHTVIIAYHWNKSIDQIPRDSNLAKALGPTVQLLLESGKKVVLVDDVYQFDFDPQRCKYLRPFSGGSVCTAPRELYERQISTYLPQLISLQRQFRDLKVIQFGDVFCNATECSMLIENKIAYRDNNHVNALGSRVAANIIAKKLLE